MRLRRFLSFPAAALLSLFVSVLVIAQAPAVAAPANRVEHVTVGTVVDDSGHVYPVTIESRKSGVASIGGRSLNYESVLFGIMPVAGAPKPAMSPNGSGDSGGCEQSGSFTVEICLTQYWQDYYSGNSRYVAVEYYAVQFNRLDPAWDLLGGQLVMGVFGRCGRGCSGTLGLSKTVNYSYPASGHTYT